VNLSDNKAISATSQEYVLSPHSTVWIDFSSFWAKLPNNPSVGGIQISYTGPMHAITASGGMEDAAVGYSHMLHFQMPQATDGSVPNTQSSTQSQNTTFDSAGIMVGAQEADMQFPQGTVFAPYLVLRNTTTNPMLVQLASNTMSGTNPIDLPLRSVTLAPLESRQIDMKSFLASAGLGAYNGYINLRTTFAGGPTDLLQESGSLDQTLNYVFEVPPQLEQTAGSHFFNYWNTNGDTDTMFTLWNYSGTAQDVILTFQHQEGKYEMPIHLAPRASLTLSVGKLIRGGVPDRNGQIIPTSIVQGSAKITGPSGSNKERISVAVAAGIFNARTGTCSYPCQTCNGLEYVFFGLLTYNLHVGFDVATTLWAVYTDGSEYNVTSEATWSIQNTSVATVNAGTLTGVSVGGTNVIGQFSSVGTGNGTNGKGSNGYNCCGASGCGTSDASDSAGADTTPQITGVSPSQGLVGSNIAPVTITGSGFGTSGAQVGPVPGIAVSVSSQSADGSSITAAFDILTDATPGCQDVTVTVTGSDNTSQRSNAFCFFVQIPTDLIPTSTPSSVTWATSNSGYPITIRNANGSIPSGGTGVCGGYLDVYYILVDQRSTQITNGTVTVQESFGPTTPNPGPFGTPVPTNPPPVLNLASQVEGDTQAVWNNTPPNCLWANASMTFNQYWTVYLGSGTGGTSYNMGSFENWTWTSNASGYPTFTRSIQ
jgi:hypothetical protein